MKRAFLAVAVFAAASAVVVAADLKDLAGSYKVTALTKGGQPAPDAAVEGIKGVTIAGDKFTIETGDGKKVATVTVDGTKKPATFDLSPDDGPEKGSKFPGIFTFEKGVLKIAVTEKGDRPKDFKGAGAEEMVITLEKAKK
jgi:uncharacterized protein (TIGR03067 family)